MERYSDQIRKFVDFTMLKLNRCEVYYENGRQSVEDSIMKYFTDAYEKEILHLAVKIDTEKSRGLVNSDSVERLREESHWIKSRFHSKVKAVAMNSEDISR